MAWHGLGLFQAWSLLGVLVVESMPVVQSTHAQRGRSLGSFQEEEPQTRIPGRLRPPFLAAGPRKEARTTYKTASLGSLPTLPKAPVGYGTRITLAVQNTLGPLGAFSEQRSYQKKHGFVSPEKALAVPCRISELPTYTPEK